MARRNNNSSKVTQEQLAAQLSGGGYTPLTQAQIQAQAEARFASVYNAKNLAAQQLAAQLIAAEDAKLGGYQQAYDASVVDQNEATAAALSNTDRVSTGRGMGRSSFNVATQANVNLKGNQALANLLTALNNNKQNVTNAKALANTQLSQTLAANQVQQAADVASAITDITNDEYAKQQAAQARLDANMTALYNLQHKSSGSRRTTTTPPPGNNSNSPSYAALLANYVKGQTQAQLNPPRRPRPWYETTQ